jgi:hypothetical protein
MLNVRMAALHLVEVVAKRSLASADQLPGVLDRWKCWSALLDRSWFAEEKDHWDLLAVV